MNDLQVSATSCLADRQNLDSGGALRSHEHTKQLMHTLDQEHLWDDYGVIDDVLVSSIVVDYCSTNLLIILWQPFTSNFLRANIHELLSPDILHQMIKGTFKDHLVLWVGTYLKKTYCEKDACVRQADIDHR